MHWCAASELWIELVDPDSNLLAFAHTRLQAADAVFKARSAEMVPLLEQAHAQLAGVAQQREGAQRLAHLGGVEVQAQATPRRRPT